MFWKFVRKELLTNLLTLWPAVVLVFTVVLAALISVIGSLDYLERLAAYGRYVEESRTGSRSGADRHPGIGDRIGLLLRPVDVQPG